MGAGSGLPKCRGCEPRSWLCPSCGARAGAGSGARTSEGTYACIVMLSMGGLGAWVDAAGAFVLGAGVAAKEAGLLSLPLSGLIELAKAAASSAAEYCSVTARCSALACKFLAKAGSAFTGSGRAGAVCSGMGPAIAAGVLGAGGAPPPSFFDPSSSSSSPKNQLNVCMLLSGMNLRSYKKRIEA